VFNLFANSNVLLRFVIRDRLEKQLLELEELEGSLDQCVVARNSQLDSVKETKGKIS